MLFRLGNFWLVLPVVLLSSPAFACSVCFKGDPQDPMNQGLRMGVLTLLGVVGFMMVSFAAFFIRFSQRAKAHGTNGKY